MPVKCKQRAKISEKMIHNGLKGYMVRNGSKIKISIPHAVQYEDPIAHPQ